MFRPLAVVSMAFRLAGLLLAVSAIASLVVAADLGLSLADLPPPDHTAPLDIGTYGVIALMANVARALAPLLRLLAVGIGFAAAIIAVLAAIALLLAILLYVIGRGIGHRATWARVVGMLLSFALALISLAAMAALRHDLAYFTAAPLGLSLYTLWALIWRFA